MMFKLKLYIMLSVQRSQPRRIMSSNVSWSLSLSKRSTQGRSICSRLSSSLRWQISLNKWDDHSADVCHFIESFKLLQADFETLFNVSQAYDRYYIVLSESEFLLWKTYDGSSHQESQKRCQIVRIKSIMLFICSIDLVMPSIICTTSGWLTASCSTIMWSQLKDGTSSAQGHSEQKFRTFLKCQRKSGRILRIVIDQESMSASSDVEFKEVKLHQFFKNHQIWAAQTELFSHNQSASLFMQSHVLYHESVSVSSWFMSETIVDIIQNTQVRLTERILKIIRAAHPHMKNLLFNSSGELKSNITEIDIDRSLTVVNVRINPWELKDSNSMDVELSVFKRGKKTSSNSGSAVLTINSGRITFG